MPIPLVDLKTQYRNIKQEIDAAVLGVLSRCDFVGGHAVHTFEEGFAAFCSARHCVGVANGTDALVIALRALGVGPGDEVITAANSFIATSEAITLTGAKVVFVDVNPHTYNIDVTKIEEKITDRTKAIIPVHLFGQPADMDPILQIAASYDLRVVEDASQAHGALYKGRRVGSLGDIACFSFYPGKNLGAYGDAGAIVTNDGALAAAARVIANHGRIDKYNHAVEGMNSRLDTIQAAVLETKLAHLAKWTEQRRHIAYQYNELLADCDLLIPSELQGTQSVFHLYVVRVSSKLRAELQTRLASRGIATGIHYPIALPNLQAYAYLKHRETDFPEATRASQEILSLPIYPELTASQVSFVADNVKQFLGELASGSTAYISECVA
jgi:dTDP-4-amino-4,6-dideoxygalactose transaminase